MDGMDADVLDAPEVDADLGEEVDLGADESEVASSGEELSQGDSTDKSGDPAFTTQNSRDFRKALAAWKATTPDATKFAIMAKDNYSRLYALQSLEPRGIDGVREKYALLDSLAVGDAKGTEAITAMQERLQASDEVDSLLAAGDKKALESLGPDFDPGLAKLAPSILDRVRQSNPEAYQNTIQPHVVETLRTSPLVQSFNTLVDILNTTDDPRLDDKAKMQMAIKHLGTMGAWLNSQSEKAGALSEVKPAPEADKFQQERAQFEQEKQEAHWNTNIKPQAAQFENAKFEEFFKPYNLRLKLDAGGKSDLQQAFKSALNKAGAADPEYMRQMKIYRAQKNPDAAAVSNYVKNAISKHSKPAMEALIKARYSSFLNGKQKAAPVAPGSRPVAPAGANVEIRTVKPPMGEIDHKNTPLEWMRPAADGSLKYKLLTGKVIQVRKA